MERSQGTMEEMELRKNLAETYRGKRVLVTGHTGFKGSWLGLWLELLGAEVYGVALPAGSGYQHSKLLNQKHQSQHFDIRDLAALKKVFTDFAPEIVFHLAAQPIVGISFQAPVDTFDVNIRGTLNVLECARTIPSVSSVVCITSDKVYATPLTPQPLNEAASFGSGSPYAASKTAAELVITSYRQCFFNSPDSPRLGVARAGNIIGGGDWGEQRLVPDLIRASYEGKKIVLRNPESKRAWLHVFDAVHGYLILGAELAKKNSHAADAFNFGPLSQCAMSVAAVLEIAQRRLPVFHMDPSPKPSFPEEVFISLDATKASLVLGWKDYFDFDEAVEHSIDWYQRFYQTGQITSKSDLTNFIDRHGL